MLISGRTTWAPRLTLHCSITCVTGEGSHAGLTRSFPARAAHGIGSPDRDLARAFLHEAVEPRTRADVPRRGTVIDTAGRLRFWQMYGHCRQSLSAVGSSAKSAVRVSTRSWLASSRAETTALGSYPTSTSATVSERFPDVHASRRLGVCSPSRSLGSQTEFDCFVQGGSRHGSVEIASTMDARAGPALAPSCGR